MSSCRTQIKKVVNRLGQLRADKFCPPRRESPKSKDFPRRGGLYAEVARRFTPSKKVVRQLGKPRRNCSVYLPLRKLDESRFSQAGGRISQCLAAEHRLKKL